MSSLVLGLRLPCWITYFPRLHPFARVLLLLFSGNDRTSVTRQGF